MTIDLVIRKIHSVFQQHASAMAFFFVLSIAILWQMLLPGYVLTLDMVFTPTLKVLSTPDAAGNALPLQLLFYALTFVIPGWVVQKLVLFGLFFCMGMSAYLFLPLPQHRWVRLWAGVFMMVNPFVYERLLAGQWQILWAYALVPLYLYGAWLLNTAPSARVALVHAVTAIGIAVFSVHVFAMCMVSWLIITVVGLISPQQLVRRVQYSAVSVIILIVGASYWLIPFIMSYGSRLVFSVDQGYAFTPAATVGSNILVTLLTGYGFWGGNEAWAKFFIWPYQYPIIFWPLVIVIGGLIVAGVYRSLRAQPRQAFLFIVLALVSLICASGFVGVFAGINRWLYETMPLWSGFRDSQKWSALLIISYAFFGAWGIDAIRVFVARYIPRAASVSCVLLLLPFLYTFTVAGGFARQLQPVWYPQTWQGANQYLLEHVEPGERVLFLPWHQYYSLPFNRSLITINPARAYFEVPVVQSENPEVGTINAEPDEEHRNIANLIYQAEKRDAAEIANILHTQGFSYILVTEPHDAQSENFLLKLGNFSHFFPVLHLQGLTLYQILI